MFKKIEIWILYLVILIGLVASIAFGGWVRQGIEVELARRLVKLVKTTKLKVQVAIQGEKRRVSGKKRGSCS